MSKFRLYLFVVMAFFSFNSFADIKSDLKQVLVDNQNAVAKFDAGAFTATTAPNLTIIDEIEPFTWTGDNASTQYIKDFSAAMKKYKLSNMVIQVKDAIKLSEGKDKAYAVFPVAISFKNAEMKVINEEGYQTVIYNKSKNGKWLIKSSAWSVIKEDPQIYQ